MTILRALAAALLCALASAASAADAGQIPADVPDHVRAWFKGVHARNGVPCCDIADGHRTTWRGGKDGGYEVPVEGEWLPVPAEAVITNAGNPVGEAVVWYTRYSGKTFIRCFVPGGGV